MAIALSSRSRHLSDQTILAVSSGLALRQPRWPRGRPDPCHRRASPEGRLSRRAAVNRAKEAASAMMLAVAIGLLACRPAAGESEPCTAATRCRDTLRLGSGGSTTYFRSVPLTRNEKVRLAVIVVHGNQRDGDRYFDRLVSAARAEGRLWDSALFAPQFHTRKDGPAPDELYWSSRGWKIGHRSLDAKRVSTFAVMDELLAQVCPESRGIFPNLETVVLIGHSAGAQFVGRYVAGGRGCPDGSLDLRYIVMNPSSYLYVDARRRSAAAGFEVPSELPCADYDNYKYGLRDLNAYMRRVGPDRIRANLFERRTYYLAGGEDTGSEANLDTSCPGNLQGENRLARYANYRVYHELFTAWNGSVFEIVPGVGHDGGRMLLSDAARRAAFR